jgi:NADPH-ferrihemoprotein reductase
MADETSGGTATLLAAASFATLCYVAYTKLFSGDKRLSADQVSSAFDQYQSGTPADGSSADSNADSNAPTRDAVEVFPCGTLKVYFGSQTGTAEEFAETLVEEGRKFGFDATKVDLEDFEPDDITVPQGEGGAALHMFAVATYGEGEPTDNAIGFNKWLKDTDSADLSGGVNFAVFGLGNTQYEHFNAMGRLVNKLLEERGGTRAYDYGEGDDDGTLEQDFETWRDGLWPALVKRFGGKEATRILGEGVGGGEEWCPAYKVTWMEDTSRSGRDVDAIATAARERVIRQVVAGMAVNDPDRSVTRSSQHYFYARKVPVLANTELRGDGGTEADVDGNYGSTIQVDLQLSKAGPKGSAPMTYRTADTLAVCCENDPVLVETLAQWQGYPLERYFLHQLDDPVARRTASYKPLFPTPCTVRHALAHYCDITSPVRKKMLPKLAQYATDPQERERLHFLASQEGREEFMAWVSIPGRTIVEVLEKFPSVRVPFVSFLELVPRLMSRDYTISSSDKVHPDTCSITVKVVREPKEGDDSSRKVFGVCSNFLLREGKSARVFVRPSTFTMPNKPSVPIILIGPGTGIAPMRAFLQERRHQRATLGASAVGDTDLFFGCRRRSEDFIYEDELMDYTRDGTLTNLHLAFSRDGSGSVAGSKRYVQHVMEEKPQAARIWKLMSQQGAHIYVCGGTKMGQQVKATVEKIIREQGRMSANKASAYVSGFQESGRYVQELWS